MIIKKYNDFLKENNNTFGEWVESFYDDEYIKNIVNRYIKDYDPTIRLANAINLLDNKKKLDIKTQITNYLNNGIKNKTPNTLTYVEDIVKESNDILSGKGIFKSFLKSLTALGKKEVGSNFDRCPDTFLIFYHYDNLLSNDVKLIFNRFKSLQQYINLFDYSENNTNLYFGIKNNGTLEYGLFNENLVPFGQFKLSKFVINWILSLELKSAFNLKKDLVNLNIIDIITLGKIKQDMLSFNPGYYENKMLPTIKDKVISFGYYGIGKWDNGKLDEGEFINIKNNFNTWVLSKKWSNKILINISYNSFWVYINIKLK